MAVRAPRGKPLFKSCKVMPQVPKSLGISNTNAWSSIKNSGDDDGDVESRPANAWQVDVSVAAAQAVPKPQDRREQIGAPRQDRYAGGLVTDPNGQHLGNRHQQGE